MTSKWTVKTKAGEKIDMFCRPLFSTADRANMAIFLVENQDFTPSEALLAASNMETDPIRCNESDEGHSIPECLHFFASYAEPNDILQIDGMVCIMQYAANV